MPDWRDKFAGYKDAVEEANKPAASAGYGGTLFQEHCKRIGMTGKADQLLTLPHFKAGMAAATAELEAELNLYKQALTQAVSLPKGVLPDSEQYYTWMNNGNCVVEKRKP